jgi:hypothetical protein
MQSMLLRLRDARPTLTSSGVLAFAAASLPVWWQASAYQLLEGGEWALGVPVRLELWLLGAFTAAFAVWVTLHVMGLVGTGTAAGFRLVLLGFATRAAADVLLANAAIHLDASGLVYSTPRRVADVMWLVRNGSLVCFGLGFGLVVLATATDLRRRRRAPAWTRAED